MRASNSLLTVLLAMIIGLIVLTLVCFLTIFLQPNILINPLSPARATEIVVTRIASMPTATDTPVPVPTYPPTWTPTLTFTPGPTKTPTDTRTPTPTKTHTPTSTATPTTTPTTVVLPTFTPFPPYTFAPQSGPDSNNNCANIKLKYSVFDSDNEPTSGYQVEYGEIGVKGSVFQTGETAFHDVYGVTLIPGTDKSAAKKAHNWFAYLMEKGQKISKAILFSTDPIWADNPSDCADIDPDSDEFAEEGCILDPCESSDAINVKHVVWRPQLLGTAVATSTPRLNLCLPPYENFTVERKCSDCATQEDAQRLFQAVGGSRVDIYDFDRDHDGIACEDLPRARSLSCSDFTSQAQAQTVYQASGGANLYTDNLDPDRNGIACEELP